MSSKLSVFYNIISDIEAKTLKSPPFVMMKTIVNTISLVDSLFEDDDISCQATSSLLMAIAFKTKMEQNIVQSKIKKRFTIKIIMYGPILCGLVGTKNQFFEASDTIIDEGVIWSSMC